MISRRRDGERGVVLPLVALVIGALVTFTAIAVDLGYQRVARRDVQALADVAALDAVRRLDGSDVTTLDPIVDAAAAQTISRNPDGVAEAPGSCTSPAVAAGAVCLDVRLGEVDAAGDFVELFGTDTPTAVQATVSTKVDYRFMPGEGEASRSAVASQQALANFMLGSFLIGVDLQTSLLNQVLPGFLGSSLSSLNITAVSWQGLAAASMNIGNFATQLGFGSPNALASAGIVNARGWFLAAATVMQNQGDTASATIFNTIAATVDSSATLNTNSIWAQQGGSSGALAAGTNFSMPGLAFLTSSVYAVNGNNFVSVPNFSLGIPGITDTTLTLELIEAPQYCMPLGQFCEVGDSVPTGQVRVQLENTIDLDLDALLLGARLTGDLVTDTTAAGAIGTLAAVRCNATGGIPAGIDVDVTTQPITTTATEHLMLSATVSLPIIGQVTQNVAQIDVTNGVTLASGAGGFARFEYPTEFLPSVGSGGTKRVGSPDLGLSTSLAASGSSVTLLGVAGFPLGTVTNVVNVGLAPTLSSINNYVTRLLARTLGLDIGGADVGAVDIACTDPLLVG